MTITVNAVNDAPILNAVGNKMVLEGSLLTFGVTASDVDGDTLTFSLVGAPAGATIIPLTGVFSWTPTDNGMATFTIRVSDGGSPQLTDEEQITVDVKNVAPTATFNTPLVTIGEGATFGISPQRPDGSVQRRYGGRVQIRVRLRFRDIRRADLDERGHMHGRGQSGCDRAWKDRQGWRIHHLHGRRVDSERLAGGDDPHAALGQIYAKGTSVPFTAKVIDPGALDHDSYLWTFVSAGDSFSVSGSNVAGVMTINSPYPSPDPLVSTT